MARDYKREWETQQSRDKTSNSHEARMERQRARRALDAKGVNRKGKDVSHRKALSSGGSNKDGYFLDTPSNNRSFPRKSNHKPKNKTDSPGK